MPGLKAIARLRPDRLAQVELLKRRKEAAEADRAEAKRGRDLRLHELQTQKEDAREALAAIQSEVRANRATHAIWTGMKARGIANLGKIPFHKLYAVCNC